jgi:hypothetical protein
MNGDDENNDENNSFPFRGVFAVWEKAPADAGDRDAMSKRMVAL